MRQLNIILYFYRNCPFLTALFQYYKTHSRSKSKSFDQTLIVEKKEYRVTLAFKVGPYNFNEPQPLRANPRAFNFGSKGQ